MKYFFFLIIIIVSVSETKLSAKDSARFSSGIGVFNFMEDGTPPHKHQSGMINFEAHSGKKLFNVIKPFIGFLGTNHSTYYAYGGFGIDGYYGKKKKNFILTPSLACGFYKDGREIKAGNPLEFYIGIDAFTDLRIMLD